MEATTCNQCKAYFTSFDGSRHECLLGFPLKYMGLNKFVQTHEYGPAKRCPRPLTEEKLKELTGGIRTEILTAE